MAIVVPHSRSQSSTSYHLPCSRDDRRRSPTFQSLSFGMRNEVDQTKLQLRLKFSQKCSGDTEYVFVIETEN